MDEIAPESLTSLMDTFSVGRIGTGLFLLVVTWIGLRLLGLVVTQLGERSPRRRLILNRAFPLLRVVVWTLAFYVVIAMVLRPPQETLLALGASAGLALGLGTQDLVKNVISGLLMLFEQPFQVGDIIEVEGVEGEVLSIGLRATQLLTFGQSIVTIPNGRVFENIVSNANSGDLRQQVSVEFQLPAHLDVVEIKKLAREVAETSPYVWLGAPIAILAKDHFDRTFQTRFSLKAYVIDIRLQRVFQSDLIERVRAESLRRGWLDEQLVLAGIGARAPS